MAHGGAFDVDFAPGPAAAAAAMPAWVDASLLLISSIALVGAVVNAFARGGQREPAATPHPSGHHAAQISAPSEDLMRWARAMAELTTAFRPLQEAPPPRRTEPLYRSVTLFHESEEEVRHTMQSILDWPQGIDQPGAIPALRLFVFVDGLQEAPQQDKEEAVSMCDTLNTLAQIFPLGAPAVAHGCALFTGVASPSNVPFEIYVKGPGAPRTKWQSHVRFMDILAADEAATESKPAAIMLGDGDCGIDPDSVHLMFRYLLDNGVGGVGPYLNPERVDTWISLHAGMRYWQQAVECRGLSALGFHYPFYGPCQLWSMDALKAITSEYCDPPRVDSLWDNARVLYGEDGFSTVCSHAVGKDICVLPNAHATIYVPDSPLDYLGQQCRWRLGESNALDLIFSRPGAWQRGRWLIWPLRAVESTMMEAPLGAGVLTLSASFVVQACCWISMEQLPQQQQQLRPVWARTGLIAHTVLWAILAAYAALAAGRPVKSRPVLNGSAFFAMILLGVLFPALIVYLVVSGHGFRWYPWGLFIITIFVARPLSLWAYQVPHGQPWPTAVLLFWVQGLLWWVDVVQAPLLAIANVEGAAGWGTRTEGEDAAKAFTEARGRNS